MDYSTLFEDSMTVETSAPWETYSDGYISMATTPLRPQMVPETSVVDLWQFKLHYQLFVYVAPTLLAGGTIGNMLTLSVMHNSEFRSHPSSFIFSALALVDTGILFTGLLRHWIRYLTDWGLDVRELSDPGCRLHYFFTYLLKHLSPCYLMLLTVERAISVQFPMKCKQLCNKRRMVIVVTCATVVEIGFNLHAFITMKLQFQNVQISHNETARVWFCYNIPSMETFHRGAWYWIDSSLYAFIPFLVIFIGNLFIICKLISAQTKRKDTMQGNIKDTGRITSTTLVLLLVSVTFLLLTLPSCIFFIGYGHGAFPFVTHEDQANIFLAYSIVNLLNYLNNSINFLLYCISGSKFRRVLQEMMCWYCRRKDTSAKQSSSRGTGSLVGRADGACAVVDSSHL